MAGANSLHEQSISGGIDRLGRFCAGGLAFSGYEPTGDYTYVYQVHCTGPASISLFSVALEGLADNIGSFVDTQYSLVGDAPYDTAIYPAPDGSANWNFAGIVTNSSSCGLVFTSPYGPMDYFSLVVDDGNVVNYIDVGSPIPVPIPEPATLSRLACGLGLAWTARRLRRS